MRRVLLPALALLVTGAVAAAGLPSEASVPTSEPHRSGRTAARAPSTDPYGKVLNILPPGNIGNVDAHQLLDLGAGNVGTGAGQFPSLLGGLANPQAFLTTATINHPKHFADQLEPYDKLGRMRPGQVTELNLSHFFKPAGLGVAADQVDHVEHPRAGVTIVWDTDGVPHITGKTDEDVAYGAGVAVMETRMFLTDVLRHTGAADMAQFVGPTDGDIAQDAAQLAVAPYREDELNAQIDALVKRSPVAARLVGSIDAYVAGINAEQTALCPATTATVPLPGGLGLGFGESCPVEYAALQKPPEPYTRADVVSIASLIGGIFGTGGGGQYTNAIWLQQLQAKFGDVRGRRMYEDLREKNDPEAPTTSPIRTPYGGDDYVHPDLAGVAMPDLHPRAQQLGTGAIVNSDGTLSPPPSGAAGNVGNASTSDPNPTPSQAADPGTHAGAVAEAHAISGTIQRALSGELVGMSNALIVDAQHSKRGHPTAVFGPQTGYYAPQLLMEEELDGPHMKARGVSFAGTNFVVEMGRGVDYAWSATSPYTDITDTVVQRLCNADGSKATVDSTAYVTEAGTCKPMIQYTHDETSLPTLAGAASPQSISFLVLRTDHGVVRRRTTLGGKPVAIVTERSTYMHEPDSVLGFVYLDDPAYVRNARDFQHAASKISFTFNWFYVDDKDIAYYSSARLPKRSPQTDIDLPRWAEKKYDWRGFEPFKAHPHAINPPTGYFANWNNKLAPGFASSSQVYGDGSVYRSLTLEDRIKKIIRHGKASRHALVGAMIDAATVDLRGAYVLPGVLGVLDGAHAPSKRVREATALLTSWVRAGAHRVDRKRVGHYDHQAAIALFDTWWDPDDITTSCSPHCGFSLPRDVLSPVLGPGYVRALPEPLDDHPREHIGSSFNGISWYGYVDKTMRMTLGRPVRGAYSRDYCGTLQHCRTALRQSLKKAVAAVLATQGVSDLSQLTYDKTQDDIVSVAGGVVGVRPIDWQNRPTFQQVVQFTGHR